jgi:hypothetical protein
MYALDKIKYLAYMAFTYLSIDKEVFGILLVLMCMDSVVGAVKSVRLGEEFRFKIMLWGITMKMIFLMIPVVLALMGKSLGYDFTNAVSVTMAILTVSEGYSIISNIHMAHTRERVRKMDIISTLLITIRDTMKRFAKSLLHRVEN